MTNHNILTAQNLLYHRPLFDYIGTGEQQMNVLVLGWDGFSEAFTDQCLQAGQMHSHFLNVRVLTADAAGKMDRYLAARPALAAFVNVNGSLAGAHTEIYADLNFDALDESALDEDAVVDILSDAPGEKYHYFLVSTGCVERNQKIARILRGVVEELMPSERNTIHYATDDSLSVPVGLCPVYTDGLNRVVDIHPNLEQMAYNAHLIWSDGINGDARSELEKFRADEYNYRASVALALSVKYKLADLGITEKSPHAAAEIYWDRIRQEENQDTINRVIALEHRRWVMDKICQGWTAPKPEDRQKFYDACADRQSNRDGAAKIHPCIVRSGADAPLSAAPFSQDRTAWDIRHTDWEQDLDELDRMSLELHRRLLVRANAYRRSNPMERGEIPEIRQKLAECGCGDGILRQWERLLFCIRNILDGNVAFSKKFKQYRGQFASRLHLAPADQSYVEQRLEQIGAKLWPVIEVNHYRDYKKTDEILVKKIPFILTYRIDFSMASGFRIDPDESAPNDALFRNVAAATVIKPAGMTYLLWLDDDVRPEPVSRMIRKVRRYMTVKGIRCRLDFLVSGLKQAHETRYMQWKKCLEDLKHSGSIDEYRLMLVEQEDDAVRFWTEEMNLREIHMFDGTLNLFRSMRANGTFVQAIRGRYPYFEFDRRKKAFRNIDGCGYLAYIEDRTYLGIEEMFGLAGAEDMDFNYPVLGNEYRRLWDIYTGHNRYRPSARQGKVRGSISNWNVMCDALEEYDRKYQTPAAVDLTKLRKLFRPGEKFEWASGRWDDIRSIIGELAGELGGKQYLIPEKTDGTMTGFRYSHPDIRSVLTKAGEILEICTYFALCEQGCFDEVACGYQFRWSGDQVSNELDLVAVKGFQSVIVECKARSKLDQNFYFKLSSLVDMFGIGAHKVMLTTADLSKDVNSMQQERGEMMGVTTLSQIHDIGDIAQQLEQLL